ncbi:MAG TPA: molybdenum cofactor guanylyltransferase [Acidobacteriaceae bacterium]|nr:molybdenum cofactor guanylyltransferase [Acidobacteriaceae bacterium]
MNGFVLAGGQSTRMGRDKALLEVNGRTLVEHMLEKLRGLGLEARICGSRSDLAPFAEVVPDNFAQSGPLGGMEAALAVSDSELNLFVAVDLPGIPEEFLGWLMGRAERSRAVATIPRYGDRLQPLCAVYSRRLVEGLRESLRAGRRKVMDGIRTSALGVGESIDVFDAECVAAAGCTEWLLEPPLAGWFRNVNTPAEYEAAIRVLRNGRPAVQKAVSRVGHPEGPEAR